MLTEKNIAVDENDAQFINEFDQHGFHSAAELLNRALLLLKEELRVKETLEESADLYAEIYSGDDEAKQWVESSIKDWE